MMKLSDPKQVEAERVYLAYTSASLSITEENQDRNSIQAGTWRKELMQRPWKNAPHKHVHHALFILLSCSTQDHQPRVTPPTRNWALPQSLIMSYRLYSLMKNSLNWSSLLSKDSSCVKFTQNRPTQKGPCLFSWRQSFPWCRSNKDRVSLGPSLYNRNNNGDVDYDDNSVPITSTLHANIECGFKEISLRM